MEITAQWHTMNFGLLLHMVPAEIPFHPHSLQSQSINVTMPNIQEYVAKLKDLFSEGHTGWS